MATAPRPGAHRKAEAARRYFLIKVDDIEVQIRPGDYGPRDEVIVRAATRKPDPEGWGYELSLQGLLGQMRDGATIGIDTLCTLFWFGRYKAGHGVSLREVIDTFPSMMEMDERVTLSEADPNAGDETDLSPEE